MPVDPLLAVLHQKNLEAQHVDQGDAKTRPAAVTVDLQPCRLLGLIFSHGFNLRISSGIDTGSLIEKRQLWQRMSGYLWLCRYAE